MKNNFTIIGIIIGILGVVALLSKEAQASKIPVNITKYLKPTIPIEIKTVTMSGFIIPLENFIQDLKNNKLLQAVECISSTGLTKKCRVSINANQFDNINNLAIRQGISVMEA